MIIAQMNMNPTQTYLIFQAGLQWACSQEIYLNPRKILECAEHRVLAISSSSYPSVFWLVGNFPSGFVASHSFHCCITASCCVSGDLFKFCSRGLPTAFFPNIAPSRMFTTNALPNCMPYPWVASTFNMFKSNISSFALWKTSSFVILSVHFILGLYLY